jgi:hypothetical protein
MILTVTGFIYRTFCREQQANLAKEDLSDMVAEHAAKQKVTP